MEESIVKVSPINNEKETMDTNKSPNKTFEVIGRFKVYTLYFDTKIAVILNKF